MCLGGVFAVPERIRHPFLTSKTGAPQTEANYPEKETPYQATPIPYPKGLARYL
ncbi:Uncharacterised protein [Mycobacterium tuberculosis]|nr:Uncharacterised protein [Mycobacterium tuberculosis]